MSPSFLLCFFFISLSLSSSRVPVSARHLLSASIKAAAGTRSPIATACASSRYPTLCVQGLSTSPPPTTTPSDLARSAVSASLASARKATTFLSGLPATSGPAVKDCKERLANSVQKLESALSELGKLKAATFRYQVDNAVTWVSAAMTNADACVAGVENLKKSPTRDEVVSRVTAVSRNTSNALYFLGRLSATKGKRI